MSGGIATMAGERSNMPKSNLLRRFQAWLLKKAADHIVGAVISLVSLTAILGWLAGIGVWLGREWTCVRQSLCTVSGWSLGVLIGVAVIFGAAAVVLALSCMRLKRRLKTTATQAASAIAALATAQAKKGLREVLARPPPFAPIQVDDERLHLQWQILKPPTQWEPQLDPQRDLSPQHVKSIIDGPFHAVPGCGERLREFGGSGWYGSDPSLDSRCPGCHAELFSVRQQPLESRLIDAWATRAQALAELQRMQRSGVPIVGPRLVLQRPQYWNKMRPP
jgi:hypothetical protein